MLMQQDAYNGTYDMLVPHFDHGTMFSLGRQHWTPPLAQDPEAVGTEDCPVLDFWQGRIRGSSRGQTSPLFDFLCTHCWATAQRKLVCKRLSGWMLSCREASLAVTTENVSSDAAYRRSRMLSPEHTASARSITRTIEAYSAGAMQLGRHGVSHDKATRPTDATNVQTGGREYVSMG